MEKSFLFINRIIIIFLIVALILRFIGIYLLLFVVLEITTSGFAKLVLIEKPIIGGIIVISSLLIMPLGITVFNTLFYLKYYNIMNNKILNIYSVIFIILLLIDLMLDFGITHLFQINILDALIFILIFFCLFFYSYLILKFDKNANLHFYKKVIFLCMFLSVIIFVLMCKNYFFNFNYIIIRTLLFYNMIIVVLRLKKIIKYF